MQINTLWIAEFASTSGEEKSHIRKRLKNDACYNVKAGAAILNYHIQRGNDLYEAIASYHSLNPNVNRNYRQRVLLNMYDDGLLSVATSSEK